MKALLFAVLLCVVLPLAGYQDAGFTVFSPTSLASGEAEISIFHRFQGLLDSDCLVAAF